MTGREYILYGANGVATAAGPSRAELPTLSCFFLEADGSAIDAYVDDVLNAISDGAVTYEAVSHHVMVSFGRMKGGRSLTPPYADMGLLDELQVGFWLAVARRQPGHESEGVDRYLTHVPYMFVDNPLSLTIGREVNGFAKSWGYIELDPPRTYGVDTYGGNFGTGETAGRRPLCTMVRVEGPDGKPEHERPHLDFPDFAGFADWMRDKRRLLPRFEALDDIWDLLSAGTSWGLFLRQLRATDDPRLAVHQEVAEAQIDVDLKGARLLPHAYDFVLHHLDSCPIDTELGLRSQRVPFGVELSLKLELRTGETRWPTAATP